MHKIIDINWCIRLNDEAEDLMEWMGQPTDTMRSWNSLDGREQRNAFNNSSMAYSVDHFV